MSSRQYKQAYATNPIEDFLSIFGPQTAEGFLGGGLTEIIPRIQPGAGFKTTVSQYFRDQAVKQGKTLVEEQNKDLRDVTNRDGTKQQPCQAGYVPERVPGTENNYYCRQRRDIISEIIRIGNIIFESVIHPQTAEAIQADRSNCYRISSGFCWRNKPCGKSSNVSICTNGGSCTSARTRWLANYACKGGTTGGTTTGGTTGGGGVVAGSRYPAKSGSSGNCTWDTKGAWCWNGIACGGKCKTCRTGYATTNISTGCTAARNYFLNNYKGCNSCKSSSTSQTQIQRLNSACAYSGCSGFSGMERCKCRCSQICRSKNMNPNTSSSGGCTCTRRTTSNPVPKPTAKACPYSGCSGASTAGSSTCFYCRCGHICGSKGIKTVKPDGSCYCKPAPTSSTSGGCSNELKTRCGFFCASRPGNPVLDSKCSCFCR